MTAIELATTKVGNGVTRKIVWISVSIIISIASVIFFAGGKYSYVLSSCDRVIVHDKAIQDLKLEVREIKTDVKWIKNRLGYKEEKQ